jgi:soluble lytic murein transglycosylase
MGLMQLMPATARTVARNVLKRGAPAKSEILRPSLNIALGSAYLKQLKQRLDGNPVLATAAYNAGPHRVSKWLPANDLSADIWVELVPYTETRRYLKRVLSYMVIYDKRLGREPKRLKERMKPIVSGQDIRIAGA